MPAENFNEHTDNGNQKESFLPRTFALFLRKTSVFIVVVVNTMKMGNELYRQHCMCAVERIIKVKPIFFRLRQNCEVD